MASDSEYEHHIRKLPTFTNEVVVIRPEVFYENVEAQKDNKFMQHSSVDRNTTNE
jgi:hypothetical protein